MDGTDVQEQDAQVTETNDQVTATDDVNLDELDGAALMEAFLSDPSHGYKTLKYGDVLEGTIMHVDRDELLVDIGSKAEGIVPSKEYSSLSSEEKEAIQIGDTLLVFVVQAENNEGHPVVSIDRAKQEKSWRKLQEIHEANDVIEAEVVNYNKGGLLVNLDGVRGFVPASQVSEIRGGDESSKQADMARLIGTKLPLKVIEINRHRNRLILSERQAVQERRDAMKESLIQELTEGEVRTGRVSSICDFGAFVDIGGADGLVHLSELSWSRVRHPNELLKIGQEVQVYVLGINPTEKKIALSIKRTQAEPWSRVENSYEVGQLVRGTVTQLANFGAFARIEDGIEGLIHVSELADERIQHPKQVVQEGQDLLLRIIRIDPQRRRMGLSLRRALDTPDADLEAVFGEGIIEERDALQVTIKAALEAEGLLGTRQDEVSEDEAPTRESSGTADPQEAIKEVGEAQVAAFEERAARAERANKQRAARGRKKEDAVDTNQTYGDDSGMSAMELAFAKLGTDLLDEEAAGKATPVDAKAKAAVEPEAEAPAEAEADTEVEAVVETPVEAEAEAPVEAEAEPVVETEVEDKAEAPVEAEAEPVVETEAEDKAEAPVEAEAEPVVETEVEDEAPVEIEAETEVKTEGDEKK